MRSAKTFGKTQWDGIFSSRCEYLHHLFDGWFDTFSCSFNMFKLIFFDSIKISCESNSMAKHLNKYRNIAPEWNKYRKSHELFRFFFFASHVYQLIPLGELNVCQLVFSVHSYVKKCCQHLHYLTNEPTSLGFCTAIIEAAEEFYECT